MKKRSFRFSTFMAWIVLLLIGAASAQAAMVRGRLVHSNGYPAAGVAVTVFNQAVGRSSPAYAGPDGMYYLYNIPPGYYYLEVWIYPGGAPVVYQIQVFEPYTDLPVVMIP